MPTLKDFADDIRGTTFQVGENKTDLWTKEARLAISDKKLYGIINTASLDVANRLQANTETLHSFLTKDSDVVALPSDLLAIHRIIIYPDSADDITSGTATGADSSQILVDTANTFNTITALKVGQQVHNVTDDSFATITSIATNQVTTTSLTSGADNLYQAGDSYVIYDQNARTIYGISEGRVLEQVDSHKMLLASGEHRVFDKEILDKGLLPLTLAGLPARYMIEKLTDDDYPKPQKALVAIFNTKASKRYFFDITYYPEAVT
jgi:hypothetical protein